ncbi:transposase [Streptomyces sp. NPDC057067]|uniref:transposase n=1 Tax=unclassified Streptomyces TaxID=2593676 RepID=UPI0036384F81
MGRGDLTDAEWKRLGPFLPVSNGRCGRWRDHRQVTDGILHRVRTGMQWRDLPERFGPWKSVYERHPARRRAAVPEGLHLTTAIEPPLCGAKDGIDLCQARMQPTAPLGNTIVGVARQLVADP